MTDSEKLDWFKIINIAGEKLTEQELRNAIYTGEWLSDAKKYFSKNQCIAYKIGEKYRRLTNIEYARLQGFPDNHCKATSPYNQYKLFGNAVPPQIISYVFSRITCGNLYHFTKQTFDIFDCIEEI